MKIDEIATLADKLTSKSTNKKAIFNLVEELIQAANHGGVIIADHHLAQLYSYFSPNLITNPKNDFDWVKLAMGKTDVRHYLNYVYCDGARIMATDGDRLHVISNYLSLKVGFYDRNQNKIEVNGEFPNIDRVIPDIKDRKYNCLISDFRIEGENPYQEYEFKPILTNLQVTLNKKFLIEALKGFSENTLIHYKDEIDNVIIKDGEKIAIIQPIRR